MSLTNKFSKDTEKIIQLTRITAEQMHHSYVSSVHLFYGLLTHKNNFAVKFLENIGFETDEIKDQLMLHLKQQKDITKSKQDEILFTPEIKSILEIAEKEVADTEWDSIDSIHVLFGILKAKDTEVAYMLKDSGLQYKDVKIALMDELKKGREAFNHGTDEDEDEDCPIHKKGNKKESYLEHFGRNLTKLAKEGKLDPVIGRDEEIKRAWQILARRKKSNILLIGTSGCGKTAIVEGLANYIASGNVPAKLSKKEIYLLDVGGMVAGSKYRGEFEKKMKMVLKECIENKNIVLFIDELHTIIGSGNSEGSMDAANILKPHLSNGDIQMIGATTTEEYQKYFEKDSALVRRFQKIVVAEPSKEVTIQILNGLKKEYESFHGVKYSNEMVKLIVELSDRYISSQAEPDKSINTMDEVGSKLALSNPHTKEYADVIQKLQECDNNLKQAIQEKKFETAAELNNLSKELMIKRDKLNKDLKSMNVTEKDVREVFSLISNVPVDNIQSNSDDAKKYINMANTLKEKVINQDEAIDIIAKAIKRKKSGIEDSKKPAVMLFSGPSGVGKSYCAKKLAEFLFNDEKKLIFLNGSEYADKTAVNRLTSANPGYVGYGEASDFEPIRQNPYSILLIDECEKMCPDIWQIFLKIFDEGELKTANGKVINFKNCVIILTSNLGSRKASKNNVGFVLGKNDKANDRKQSYETAIKDYFKPEVFNRFSKVVVFNDLNEQDLRTIVKLEIKPIEGKLLEKGIKLKYDEKVCEFLLKNSEDKDCVLGARPIRRSIETHMTDALSDMLLEKGDSIKTITITVVKNHLVFKGK